MISIRRSVLLFLAIILIYIFYQLNSSTNDAIFTVSHQKPPFFDTTIFKQGTPKPPGSKYTRELVVARTSDQDVSWIVQHLPKLPATIYTVDNRTNGSMPLPTSSLITHHTISINKGHEAMAYLTYIIDHYDNLPDVVLFFHPHRQTWHNNIVLEIDNVETIKRLSSPHVIRQGYFNTRCHLDPGCPNWLHIDRSPWRYDLIHRPEEPYLTSQLFSELHPPNTKPPARGQGISQPCCAQFAVSGARIRERPLSHYTHYRDFLISTSLDDRYSGRLMEYTWQHLFTGLWEYCPAQHVCYCDGYGICFEDGEAGLNKWLKILQKKEKVDFKMVDLWDRGKGETKEYDVLLRKSEGIQRELDELKVKAVERGYDARIRAEQCGRVWREGDGY